MKEFKLTDEFRQYGYIHCNFQEEFDDMIKWFKNNANVKENTTYSYNNLYYMAWDNILRASKYKYSEYDSIISSGNYILEWTNYMSIDNKTFTKDMLKDGMVVECVNGKRYLKLNDNFINDGYMSLNSYNNDLTLNRNDKNGYNVCKIYKSIDIPYISKLFDDEYLELIWERKEGKPLELTMEDIEKQYGCKVKIVNK